MERGLPQGRFFAEDIRYEDFNYPKPFLGKPQVKEFVEAFDLPGIDFVPTELSKGDDACCFTWIVKVNGNAGPKGVSFYGSNTAGQIDYIRTSRPRRRRRCSSSRRS